MEQTGSALEALVMKKSAVRERMLEPEEDPIRDNRKKRAMTDDQFFRI